MDQSNKQLPTVATIDENALIQKSNYKPAELNVGCLSSSFQFRFQQIQNSYLTGSVCGKIKAIYKWRTQFENKGIPQSQEQLEKQLPLNKNPQFKCPNNKIRYTWIGHSTAVISIGQNTNIIIDPVFSDRCSPLQCIGPKRFREPACKVKGLPKIDLVLVSHDHYDHLDEKDLNQLQQLFQPQFAAGLRSDDVFPKKAIQDKRFHEFDWTQTKNIEIKDETYQVTFVPVCHWSRRGLFDLGKRLWGGFVIKTPNGHKIFYSGDTGYCSIFKQIGQLFGGFDLCILPIGAYQPRQLLKNQHFNPEDAVLAHKDLKSKKSVGVHWGTFPLGWQCWHGARSDLKVACQKHGLQEDQFITVFHGNSFQIQYQIKKF